MEEAGNKAPPPAPPRGRATRAEVDLDALAGNVRALRERLRPGVELMAVVKANAYGHGDRVVAREVLAAGASRLAVATVGEGRRLRAAGIAAPVLVLGPIDLGEVDAALRADLELTVGTEALLRAIERLAAFADLPKRAQLHVKVDTGMHRYGATEDLAVCLARAIAGNPRLELAGLATHFASADEPGDVFAPEQKARFDHCLGRLATEGIRPARCHVANSGATLRGDEYHYDMVRVGIAMYGLPPWPETPLPAPLRPVLALRSRVMRVFALSARDTVGYGRTYRPAGDERAALVPIGYADGYRRAASNRGWVGIGGKRADVLGRVSMDQTVVRLPEGAPVDVGDEVVVAGGSPAEGAPSIDDLAALFATNAYEVLTGIARRVPRHYLRGSEVVAVDDGLAGG